MPENVFVFLKKKITFLNFKNSYFLLSSLLIANIKRKPIFYLVEFYMNKINLYFQKYRKLYVFYSF